jgi:hypothetical protein
MRSRRSILDPNFQSNSAAMALNRICRCTTERPLSRLKQPSTAGRPFDVIDTKLTSREPQGGCPKGTTLASVIANEETEVDFKHLIDRDAIVVDESVLSFARTELCRGFSH